MATNSGRINARRGLLLETVASPLWRNAPLPLSFATFAPKMTRSGQSNGRFAGAKSG